MQINDKRILFFSLVLFISYDTVAYSKGIEYLVPEGFSDHELESSDEYLATFNSTAVPAAVKWSYEEDTLYIDPSKIMPNEFSLETVYFINSLLKKINYKTCQNWCKQRIDAYIIELDKVNKRITLNDKISEYYSPDTKLGLVHNNYIDINKTSSGYTFASVAGQSFLGLPSRTFGTLNWYYNKSEFEKNRDEEKSLGSWYFQKNFNDTYIRSGVQDSRDYSTGINAVINTYFDHFVTIGSQENLLKDRGVNRKLTVYASQEVSLELYKDSKLIKKISANAGRNDIDYNQLPAGFYDLEIRQVSNSGIIINKDVQHIVNIAYGTGHGWFATLGKLSDNDKPALNTGFNYQNNFFSGSSNTLIGNGNKFAFENNISRKENIGDFYVQPTIGIIAGDSAIGSYLSFSINSQSLGSLNASYYSGGNYTELYSGRSSSSFSYGRTIGKTRVSYNFNKFSANSHHQIQTTWSDRFFGINSYFSVGIERNTTIYDKKNFGVFLNTTFFLENGVGSASINMSEGRLTTNASYTKQNNYENGSSATGIDVSKSGRVSSANVSYHRNSPGGDYTLSSGIDGNVYNVRMNYSGMFAANSKGYGFGKASTDGVALLVESPKLDYDVKGYFVENSPVGTDSIYAVPINSYESINYAKAESRQDNLDMTVKIPANITRAHPGQVYYAHSDIDLNISYTGFFVDEDKKAVHGNILETGDVVLKNGLFSIYSKLPLEKVTVVNSSSSYICNMKNSINNYYTCKRKI